MSRPKLTAPVRRGARLFRETGPDFDVVCIRLQRGGWSGPERRDFHAFSRWLGGMADFAAAAAGVDQEPATPAEEVADGVA